MERLGESLQKAADSGELCRQRLELAFRTTCEGVGHLHNLLIAHTDIKPSNICFKDPFASDAKLIDFDAAENLQHSEQIMQRQPNNVVVWSPERREEGSTRRFLPEDVFAVGYTFAILMKDVGDKCLWLRAQVKPLLRVASARPSMHQALQHTQAVMESEHEPLPALLGSKQCQTPLEKMFGL
ncbi:CTSC [Symbiodinium sp. CCMP2592]|nr:CTSC [Symbiodinium sp. CCMP2592]